MSDLDALQQEMTDWRRTLHRHPEFGFEERRTAAFVAAKLREFGFDEVVEGVGGTGVVATLKRGSGDRSIALRADMDAVRIEEQGDHAHKSQSCGLMHACGHDGHTTMLLGAAKRLRDNGGFDGTIRFVFQPAEEWGKGALAMLADGLLDRFPFDEIYGLHNMPGYPVGQFQVRCGAMMSAEDIFEITLTGVGGHASRPHVGSETLVAACALVANLQTIVSRRLDPAATAVVSVTELITDGARNVLPGLARILGDVRSFHPDVSTKVEEQMRVIAEGTARAHNVAVKVAYSREFVPLINDAACASEAAAAAREALGAERVAIAGKPITASEDFAYFLARVPGCFAFLGAGVDRPPLHNPRYDFNDAILIDGVLLYEAIARRRLFAPGAPPS
jgi:hippurate hydrolase